MLTAHFSDGGRTGALLFQVHLHFRSYAAVKYYLQ